VARIHASSGTTGKPTVVGYTLRDIDTWAGVVARSIRAAGARPRRHGACELRLRPVHRRLGAHYGAEKLGLTVVPFGGGQTERQVQLIQDFRPDIIMVTPSYMLAIADEFERQGIDPGAQPAHRHLRRRALDQRHAQRDRAARMGIDAVDIYGL
jgi:phenylacetate-CoA ligase